MRLSRTVGYAIVALAELANAPPGSVVPSRKLAEAGSIPDRFLLQILRSLVSCGVLRSTRGVVGGYTLARCLDEISLLEVIEALEDPIRFEMPATHQRRGHLDEELQRVCAEFREHLASIKLSRFLGRPGVRQTGS
jgi:Rrf2 family protein